MPCAISALGKRVDLEVDRRAKVQIGSIRRVLGHKIPKTAAAAGCRRWTRNPRPSVSIEVHESTALVCPEPSCQAPRWDVCRVCLCVPDIPVRAEVHLLAARDHDVHGRPTITGDNGCDVSGRARGANGIGAVAARRAPDRPVLASGVDGLSVDSRQVRVGDGELERARSWGQKGQDIVAALVHELAVARPRAV